MQNDPCHGGSHTAVSRLAAQHKTPSSASPMQRLDTWQRIQLALFIAGLATVGLLLFVPTVGLHLFWNILIPSAPALVVVAPGLWRNICPMASLSLLPHRLDSSRRLTPTRRTAELLSLASVTTLLLIVPYRHISLNTNGPLSAWMLIAAGLVALWMGTRYNWRSGWCTSLCPIHPVERLYGLAPALTFRNARCTQCDRCSSPCPDSTRSMTPAITTPSPLATALGQVMIGGFAGFIWGWNQVPDLSGPITTDELLRAYLWPYGGGLVSGAAYAVLYHFGSSTKAARTLLVRVFAAAAVSTYYWYRLPALVGLGLYPGCGMLIDLAALLPPWTEHALHTATTLFFCWFMVIRPNPRTSWSERPTLPRPSAAR